MNQDLTLRPIPGPDPVALPANDWWLWLIPIILIGFLWYWWTRKQNKGAPTWQDRLYQALAQAEDTSLDPRQRYQELHQSVRGYLATIDVPQWKSLTAGESLPAWQQLFQDQPDLAQQWFDQWKAAEANLFSPSNILENQVAEYATLIRELDQKLAGNDEKSKKTDEVVSQRNKTTLSSE